MAELADALRSGRSELTLMRVQIPPPAQEQANVACSFFFVYQVYFFCFRGIIRARFDTIIIVNGKINEKYVFDIRRLMFYGIMLLLFFLLMNLSARVNELNQLSEQYQFMDTNVAELRATNSVLETKIAFATSDTAVDEYAREQGYMVKPGEILVIPISPENVTPEPIVEQVKIAEPLPNWKIWYQLFFAPAN